jgi:hypothetical protein
MKTEQIERDIEAFASAKRGPTPLRAWFDARAELRDVVERKVAGGYPALAMYLYLAERHGFPFGESTFRRLARGWRMAAQRGAAA